MPITAIETDGRVSVFTGADGKPTMPLLNTDGSIPTGPGSAPSNQPVTIADGANVTLGAKADTAGANAGVVGQTAMSRLSGIWTVLGSLTDAAATAWDTTSGTVTALLKGIGGYLKTIVTNTGLQGTQPMVDINRPNDTTPYADGDVTGSATIGYQVITGVGPAGCLAYLTNLFRQMFLTTLPTGLTGYTYHFYDAQPTTDIPDNSPWVLTVADQPHYLGNVTINNMAVVGSGSTAMLTSDNPIAVLNGAPSALKLAAGSTSLWYFAVLLKGYTPTAQMRKITRFSFLPV